ncbi:hypothetical protein CL633_00700 [bacterium]|nr:hypothetical protein [bacterium]|tara:strand:+ start:4953 stop:5984 length:1032 start_codon:yes stop_codon:yes gene_type:complete
MKKLGIFILSILGFLIIAPFLFFGFLEYQIFMPKQKQGAEVHFVVESGQSASQIGEALDSLDLIRNSFYFETYIWQKELETALQAGEYVLSPNMNIPKLVSIITGGNTLPSDKVVFLPAGLTYRQIEERLVDAELLDEQDLIFLAENPDEELLKSHIAGSARLSENSSLEGFLFPDTYRFHKDSDARMIAEKMLTNFDKKFNLNLQQEIIRQEKTIYEVVTLASIVQKEAVSYEDMRWVAGVFLNRLKINKPLESDATVNYSTGKNLRQPSYKDTYIDSPYNTYKNIGLPPSPICNPSLSAIKAVIYPKEHNYLYFLHPKNAKMGIYSKTYAEHLRNKNAYLK